MLEKHQIRTSYIISTAFWFDDFGICEDEYETRTLNLWLWDQVTRKVQHPWCHPLHPCEFLIPIASAKTYLYEQNKLRHFQFDWVIDVLIDWYLHLLNDWCLTPYWAVLYTTAKVYIHFILYFIWFTLYCMSFILHRLKFIMYCIQSYTIESHYLELTSTVFVDNMMQISGQHIVFFLYFLITMNYNTSLLIPTKRCSICFSYRWHR